VHDIPIRLRMASGVPKGAGRRTLRGFGNP
jgi:hypothetical protein